MRHASSILISTSVLSILSCAGFVSLGVLMALGSSAPFIVYLSGGVISAYGLVSLYLLVAAWRHPKVSLERIARGLTLGFIGLWVIGAMDEGMISPLEWGGLFIVAAMLIPNYLAVYCTLRNHAQPVVSPNAGRARP